MCLDTHTEYKKKASGRKAKRIFRNGLIDLSSLLFCRFGHKQDGCWTQALKC